MGVRGLSGYGLRVDVTYHVRSYCPQAARAWVPAVTQTAVLVLARRSSGETPSVSLIPVAMGAPL